MDQETVRQKLIAVFDQLPRQLRQAARYVLDHPRDVALMSMREQAREAGVPAATMTRLAQRIGYSGFDSIRAAHAAVLRGGTPDGFSAKGGVQVERQRQLGDQGLAADMLDRLSRQIAGLANGDGLGQLERVARLMSNSRHIYCIGLRSSFGIAWHLYYMLSLISSRAVLIEGVGDTGIDLAGRIGPGDVLVAVSVAPYTRATIKLARHAGERGATIIAMTDSTVSPLARIAEEIILVPTESPSYLHTMTPAFAIAEILGALVAGHLGESALSALEHFDTEAEALEIHIHPRSKRRRGDR